MLEVAATAARPRARPAGHLPVQRGRGNGPARRPRLPRARSARARGSTPRSTSKRAASPGRRSCSRPAGRTAPRSRSTAPPRRARSPTRSRPTSTALIPNSTDVAVFDARPWTILNFAVIGNETRYHSAGDELAALDRRSLQHMGDQALAVTELAASGAAPAADGRAALHRSRSGCGLIVLPLLFGLVLLGILFLFFLVEGWRRRALGRPLLAMARRAGRIGARSPSPAISSSSCSAPAITGAPIRSSTTTAVYASALAACVIALLLVARHRRADAAARRLLAALHRARRRRSASSRRARRSISCCRRSSPRSAWRASAGSAWAEQAGAIARRAPALPHLRPGARPCSRS